MTTHSGVETAVLIVEDSVQFSGIAQGGAVVRSGGTFHVSGIVSGPLTIEAGGRALVSGVLSGSVSVEKDAVLDLTGIISGAVLRNDGHFHAAVGAVVHGKQFSNAGTFVQPRSDVVSISDSTPRLPLGGIGTRLTVRAI